MGGYTPAEGYAFNLDFENMTHMVITILVFQCMLSLFGYLYVEAEAPRISNEKLLKDLDEGVFIMEEATGALLFSNDAAKRVNQKLVSAGS